MQTKALFFTEPGAVVVRTIELPPPAPWEVRIETLLSGISAGTELLVYRGQLPPELSLDASIAALSGGTAYPLQYGYCTVGRVADCGEGVNPEMAGRQVFAFHPHQAAFHAHADEVIVLPEGLAAEDAVFLPNTETALGLVMDAAPLAGERVAVVGQGVVGLLTTALLAGFPLDRLAAFDPLAARRKASLTAGAQESHSPESPPADCRQAFDLVFELSGAPAALDTAIRLAGAEGRIVVGSWYGTKRAPIDLGGHFHRGRLKLVSSQVSSLAPHLTGRWTKARRMDFAVRLLGRIRPSRFITHRFPLGQAGEAYRLLAESPESCLQVVFDYVPGGRKTKI